MDRDEREQPRAAPAANEYLLVVELLEVGVDLARGSRPRSVIEAPRGSLHVSAGLLPEELVPEEEPEVDVSLVVELPEPVLLDDEEVPSLVVFIVEPLLDDELLPLGAPVELLPALPVVLVDPLGSLELLLPVEPSAPVSEGSVDRTVPVAEPPELVVEVAGPSIALPPVPEELDWRSSRLAGFVRAPAAAWVFSATAPAPEAAAGDPSVAAGA